MTRTRDVSKVCVIYTVRVKAPMHSFVGCLECENFHAQEISSTLPQKNFLVMPSDINIYIVKIR